MTTKPGWDTADEKGKRDLEQQEVRHIEEASRNIKAVGMKQQGSWLNWQGVRSRALSWSEIWKDPKFTLCKDQPASLQHVSSSYQVALKDGRYTWRHDSVLKTLAARLDNIRRKKKKVKEDITFVNFMKAGESKDNTPEVLGVLATATDWKFTADIQQRMSFPAEIAATSLRPDMVLWSQGTRQTVLQEMTVPWEERMDEAHERKMAKYQQLEEDC
ncbi:unnamed protein product [Mytilus coruscus]|uniref:Uncharacterized protein n=1 Tax=Mytilus coruscus TaxID=42192 RepID=A0A6J8EKZ3_MYTCO|nr:unnamed protein product [Mytilus coruscus]